MPKVRPEFTYRVERRNAKGSLYTSSRLEDPNLPGQRFLRGAISWEEVS